MDYNLDIILNRNNYGKIYNINLILITILLISCYIIFTFKLETYYYFKGKISNNELEITVNLDELEYLNNNNTLFINGIKHTYQISNISNLYIDDNYNNYLHVYLNVSNLSNIDNYVYSFKILKDNKNLAKYLIDNL